MPSFNYSILFRETLLTVKLTINISLNAAGSPAGEPCGRTCLEERDNQWLGVTLSRQPGENGSIVVGIKWARPSRFWNQTF